MRARVALAAALLLVVAGCGDDGDAGDAGSVEDVEQSPRETEPEPEPDEVVAGATDDAELGPPYVGELTFVLPEDCGVAVEERRDESDGTEIELTYTLTFNSSGLEDGTTLVTIEDIGLDRVVVEGVERDPATVEPVVFERPSLVVEADAYVRDVVGAEELASRLPIDPAAASMVQRGLELDMSEKVWDAPIGLWAALGAVDEPETTVVIDDGVGLQREATVTSVGTHGDLVVLRMTSEHAPEAVEALVAASFPELGPAVEQVSVDDVVEVVTDPSTLWPASAAMERVAEASDDGEVLRRSERRTMQFDWASSDC